jgi:2-polyprenyl-3-methyl-5-hydroxy-6-metoxy-1,4-benzoquinol methylase
MSFQDLYVRLIEDIDYEPIVEWISKQLNTKQHILDAGCGSGVILVPLSARGYDVVGVDIDTTMLAYAQQALLAQSLPVQLFEHDLREPLVQDFDVILLFNDVINYFKGVKQVFNRLKQALNPSGFILFDVYKMDYLSVMDGYVETESQPFYYQWTATVHRSVLLHIIQDQSGTYQVKQYVYPLDYYTNTLKGLGFQVEVTEGPDERKHYVKASL